MILPLHRTDYQIDLRAFGPVMLALGQELSDWMEKHNNYTYGLSIIFGFGVLFAFVSFAFYLRMPNTEREVATAPSMRASIAALAKPLQDKRFVWLLVFLVFFVFAQTFAAPFFFPYGRQVLHLEFFQFQVFAAFQAAATLLSAPMWGYLSDKYGNKPVLFISGFHDADLVQRFVSNKGFSLLPKPFQTMRSS